MSKVDKDSPAAGDDTDPRLFEPIHATMKDGPQAGKKVIIPNKLCPGEVIAFDGDRYAYIGFGFLRHVKEAT